MKKYEDLKLNEKDRKRLVNVSTTKSNGQILIDRKNLHSFVPRGEGEFKAKGIYLSELTKEYRLGRDSSGCLCLLVFNLEKETNEKDATNN